MRRDRHKFSLEAFSVMAPITWHGSTPASNRRPEILREEKGSSAFASAWPLVSAHGGRGVCLGFESDGDAWRQILHFPFPGMCRVFQKR